MPDNAGIRRRWLMPHTRIRTRDLTDGKLTFYRCSTNVLHLHRLPHPFLQAQRMKPLSEGLCITSFTNSLPLSDCCAGVEGVLLEYRIWQGVLWQLRPRSHSIHQCTEVCKLDGMILMRKHKLEGPICRIGLLVLTHLPRDRLLSCGTVETAGNQSGQLRRGN